MFAWIRLLRIFLAALLAASFLVSAAHAQKWTKLAPFPEPSEELLGAAAGGKMYVFCGLAPGWKPKALVYEYDPATDQWTKKKPMALPSHHVAFTEHGGKIYAFGGFVLPQSGPPSWVPINNAWEYDPANDNWKALAPMPTKRGSPVAVSVGGIGRPPGASSLLCRHGRGIRPDHQYVARTGSDADAPQSCLGGRSEREDLRDRRAGGRGFHIWPYQF
jgi:N-acetylneuraminic acid mutarotase